MKRFNIDEFIWFLTLVLLTWIMIYFGISGRIVYFINVDMIKYFYVSIGILVLFSIFQIRKIFTPKNRTNITNKFLPILFTILICIIFLYVLPIIKGYKGETRIDDNISSDSNIISISSKNYKILKEIEFEEESYSDKKIYMVGFIERDGVLDEDEVYLSREIISCCQNDKSKVKIKITGVNNSFKNGTWIKVLGKIKYNDGWYVDTLTFQKIDEPYDIFFHEEL